MRHRQDAQRHADLRVGVRSAGPQLSATSKPAKPRPRSQTEPGIQAQILGRDRRQGDEIRSDSIVRSASSSPITPIETANTPISAGVSRRATTTLAPNDELPPVLPKGRQDDRAAEVHSSPVDRFAMVLGGTGRRHPDPASAAYRWKPSRNAPALLCARAPGAAMPDQRNREPVVPGLDAPLYTAGSAQPRIARQRTEAFLAIQVTVGVPLYNGAATLRRAVESILRQTHAACLIQISDDGSTDASGEAGQALAASPRTVSYTRQPANLGPTANFRFPAATGADPLTSCGWWPTTRSL